MLTTIFAIALSPAVFADDYSDTINTFKKSDITRPFFKNCYGYAVFPTVGKGGLVVGAAYGNGQVYKSGNVTGTVSLAKVTFGFQIGGQAFSEIIFFKNKHAYKEFTSGNFEFDASASAVAITLGAQAKAGTEGATAGASYNQSSGEYAEINYSNGMAIFVHTKAGLMFEAAIGGQKFKFVPK
ncbi:MAG: lipid-binding SYLF domain-containing protein [Desulfobacteraceae bacterium]|nr:lipid-binding SYLF domain-containing protein [Desulfobacteraceae bacterium]